MKEKDMVAGAKEGSTDAQARLVERFREPVYGFLYRYVGNADDAEDLCQEAFVRALRRIDSFRAESSLQTWLFTIAANIARDWLRREKRRGRRRSSFDEDWMSQREAEGVDNGIAAAAAEERNNAVREAVARLPERERAVVLLRTYEELSYEDIAEVLGCTHMAVGPLLHRARRRLAESLTAFV